MIKIKMCLAFIAEFLSCIKSLPLSCSWQCAKLKAVLCEHRLKIERARKEGERAYLCDKKLTDNPYMKYVDVVSGDGEKVKIAFAWDQGFLDEKSQWEWKIKD